jgi:hypothetical protein
MLVILNKVSEVYYKLCRNETWASDRGIFIFGGDIVADYGFISYLEAVGYSITLILIHKSRRRQV